MVESRGTGGTRTVKNKKPASAKYATEEERLRDLIGRLYQIASQVVMSDQPDEAQKTRLLYALANPDGEAARKLIEGG